MDSCHEEFIAVMKTNKVRMKANQEMLEASPEEMDAIVEYQEVRNEEATAETVAALED
jgi:hypothetical protein